MNREIMLDKTIEEKIAVMQAYVDGKKIEVRGKNGVYWCSISNPSFNWDCSDYRVAKHVDSINWDHVNKDYFYMARDADGEVYLYERLPRFNFGDCVWFGGGLYAHAKGIVSYVRGDLDWKESLVARTNL